MLPQNNVEDGYVRGNREAFEPANSGWLDRLSERQLRLLSAGVVAGAVLAAGITVDNWPENTAVQTIQAPLDVGAQVAPLPPIR